MSGNRPPDPARTLPDGTPCWCIDFVTDHSPRCLTLRALTGGYDFAADPTGPQRRTTSQRAKKRLFLLAFMEIGTLRHGCEAADVHPTTVRTWKREDPAFAREFEAAYEFSIDLLEKEAIRRAFDGWEETVYQGGKAVGTVRKFSDVLLIFLMKGARPGKYRDNSRVELTGADGGPIQSQTVSETLNDHERARLRQIVEDAIKESEAVG